MKYLIRLFVCLFFLLNSASSLLADEWIDWRDKMELLTYSPRYFGPNAFPVPELRSGLAGSRYEIELRGEYHYYTGDKTRNMLARIYVPFVKGRAGVEVNWTFLEDYKMTPETRDERNAAETENPITCHGDLVVNCFFQLLKSEKWADILISASLKTASGNRLCDARYTDAAAYWFDGTIGRNIFQSAEPNITIRLQAMMGFYCWMTNDLVHRQNDAILYGGGLSVTYRNFKLMTDLSGLGGYKNNGDRPLSLRNHLSYEYKKNVLSFRYNHGMKDRLYDTYSLGYTRCF